MSAFRESQEEDREALVLVKNIRGSMQKEEDGSGPTRGAS
jgi:hypothetical protein